MVKMIQLSVPGNIIDVEAPERHAEADVLVARDEDICLPACNCIDLVRGTLNQEGAELGVFWGRGRPAVSLYVRRVAHSVETPPFVLARFCPFCGTPYEHPDRVHRPSEKESRPIRASALSPGVLSFDPREEVLALIKAGMVRLDLVVTRDGSEL